VQRLDLSDYGLLWWGGPIAFILVRKNIVKIKKVNQTMREFFINEFGMFEVDSETQYRYGKQPMSFYNSHGTTIPKKIAKRVNSLYQKGKFMEVRRELEQIYPELKQLKFNNIYELFRFLVEFTNHKAIDIDTEKFLPYYRAYNPISIKRLNEVCQAGRKAVDSLHPNMKPPMPIIFAIVAGIIGLAVIQNGPKYMREFERYIEELTGSEPVPVVEAAPVEVINATVQAVEPVQVIMFLQTIISSFL